MNLELIKRREDLRAEKSAYQKSIKVLHLNALRAFTQEAVDSFDSFFTEHSFDVRKDPNSNNAPKATYNTMTVALGIPEKSQDTSLSLKYAFGDFLGQNVERVDIDIVNETEDLKLGKNHYPSQTDESIKEDIQNLEKEVSSLRSKVEQGSSLRFLYQIRKNPETQETNVKYRTFLDLLGAIFTVG